MNNLETMMAQSVMDRLADVLEQNERLRANQAKAVELLETITCNCCDSDEKAREAIDILTSNDNQPKDAPEPGAKE
jgi:hypothetical protein